MTGPSPKHATITSANTAASPSPPQPDVEPVVGTPEPDESGFGTRQSMRKEIVSLTARLAETEAQRDRAREFAAEKQTSLVRQWHEAAEAAQRRVDTLEAALSRFLAWDALNPSPDPVPAPFGDLTYWLPELRAALDSAASQPAQPDEKEER